MLLQREDRRTSALVRGPIAHAPQADLAERGRNLVTRLVVPSRVPLGVKFDVQRQIARLARLKVVELPLEGSAIEFLRRCLHPAFQLEHPLRRNGLAAKVLKDLPKLFQGRSDRVFQCRVRRRILDCIGAPDRCHHAAEIRRVVHGVLALLGDVFSYISWKAGRSFFQPQLQPTADSNRQNPKSDSFGDPEKSHPIYAESFRGADHLRRILEEAQAIVNEALTVGATDEFHGQAKDGGDAMSEQARASHPIYSLLPTEIEGFDSLAELALDLRWSWNHATDKVWRQLDPELWELTHNPWVVLQTVSRDQIETCAGRSRFSQER